MKNAIPLKPMSLTTAASFFAGGAVLFYVLQHYMAPTLAGWGLNPVLNLLVLNSPHALFFFGALIAFRKEGNQWSREVFSKRFRIHKIKGKLWFWAALFAVVNIALYLLMYNIAFPLVEWLHETFSTPAIVTGLYGDSSTFAGHALKGNWWLLGVFLVILFFNVMGEELLWRGYIFPRQELTHGKHTWVVHGLMWTGFHLFSPYNALLVLPGALFMSYIVQRHKNTSLFIISHATLNLLASIRIISGIMG